jgi:hypothetical protein
MLEIFNEYHLNKYITTPCVPPIDALYPTPDESLDMIRNLRTVNLIIRGLPRNLIVCLPTLECAYTIWRYLEKRFPNYSLKNLDEILQKSIALNKMNSSDRKFGDYLFELRDLMQAKGDVGIISDIISQVIRIHKYEHCHGHKSNELPSLGNDHSYDDDVEHGYYDEDDDSDFDLDESMRHFGLMANLRGYMAGGKELVLDSGCTDHMTGDKDMFRELAGNNGPRKYVTFGDNSKGKVVGLGKVAISHDSSIQNVMLIESLGYNLLFVSRLADFGFNVLFTEVDCQVFRRDNHNMVFTGIRRGDLYIVDFT